MLRGDVPTPSSNGRAMPEHIENEGELRWAGVLGAAARLILPIADRQRSTLTDARPRAGAALARQLVRARASKEEGHEIQRLDLGGALFIRARPADFAG
jgi:hypothetical protein